MFDPTLPVALWAMTSLTHLGMNSYRKDPTKEPFAIPTQFSHLSNLQYLDIGTYAPDIGKKINNYHLHRKMRTNTEGFFYFGCPNYRSPKVETASQDLYHPR